MLRCGSPALRDQAVRNRDVSGQGRLCKLALSLAQAPLQRIRQYISVRCCFDAARPVLFIGCGLGLAALVLVQLHAEELALL